MLTTAVASQEHGPEVARDATAQGDRAPEHRNGEIYLDDGAVEVASDEEGKKRPPATWKVDEHWAWRRVPCGVDGVRDEALEVVERRGRAPEGERCPAQGPRLDHLVVHAAVEPVEGAACADVLIAAIRDDVAILAVKIREPLGRYEGSQLARELVAGHLSCPVHRGGCRVGARSAGPQSRFDKSDGRLESWHKKGPRSRASSSG